MRNVGADSRRFFELTDNLILFDTLKSFDIDKKNEERNFERT